MPDDLFKKSPQFGKIISRSACAFSEIPGCSPITLTILEFPNLSLHFRKCQEISAISRDICKGCKFKNKWFPGWGLSV